MPRITFPIQSDGLICDVMIGLDGKDSTALVAAGQPVPSPIRCRGLIDTGSDITCVAPAVLRQLGLNVPVAKTKTGSTTASASVGLFEVSVNVLDLANPSAPKLIMPDLAIMEIPAPLLKLDVLIGLDVLLTTRLLLDGPAGQFTLEF